MQRTLCLLLTLGLATTALVPSMHAHPADSTNEVKLYLNRSADGALILSENPPSSRNATTWTATGTYATSQGLKLRIALTDPNPNWVIDESQRPSGWITYGFKQTPTSTLPGVRYSYGAFEWLLVEGERSSRMMHECATPNSTNPRHCDAYRYATDFPGHAKGGAPHTHGDGTDRYRGLHSGDLEWVLTYTVPPCQTLSTSFCGPMGGTMRYEFSVVLDGTTFLRYVAIDEEHPVAEPVAEAPSNATAGNETSSGNETAPDDPDGGNGTTNGTGSQGNSFRPQAYEPQSAQGTAPGAGLAAILATLAVGIALRRRRD